ncbi:hypothetical protein MRB53_008766 [Persea americana]|uniref:Uncharacterized protein n=1 Tax=Persea americana TaxID=3435 RepID=A0ACC2LN71_PERAE|nr:hypothetical protein MRB53_008766 [Persea americana]|eukprot:TRINITY_DN81991_c0_g1_i1.p1 TRINITY_DN81991_c0_g1~~TRINITY_DN81991_c0_g1_i1.p1  ORF type:complete len:313 (+),score=47.25 TRINITY_DN81991_c0_g1_i1:254-1192(+)
MDEVVAKEETLPPGFRFHPTDEELITYYLTHKIADTSFTGRAITDVDLNKCEPWDLPGKAKMGEKEWYFFSLRDRKYPTGVRTNRATNAGYWKTTGKDKEIFKSATATAASELVGMKKTLVFYKGRAPRGEKTNWVIHEYRRQSKSGFKTAEDAWVVCRVFQKSSGVKRYHSHAQSKANPNPYNLDMGNNVVAPVMQADGRSYVSNADLAAGLTRVFRVTPGPGVNFPTQPNYPGNFTLSGINLNRGTSRAPTLGPAPNQPAMLPTGATLPMSMPVTRMTESGMCSDMHHYGSTRFQHMDPNVDLDGYWPPY